MIKSSLTLTLTALLVLPRPAPAQWTNDPYRGMVSVCNDPGYQDDIRTCALAGGNTLFAWDDMRMGIDQVYYQVLDSDGLPLLETNGLPLFDGNWVYGWGNSTGITSLFPDGEGGAILVIWDWRAGGIDSSDIYGQRIDVQGNRLWGPTGLPLVLWPGNQLVTIANKDIVADSLGNIFIVWAPGVVGDTTQLYIQKFDASGQLPWGPYGVPICQIVPSQSGAGIAAQLVPDEAGGIMASWGDYRWNWYVPYAFLQHLDSDGHALLQRNGVPVLTGTGVQFNMGFGDGAPDGHGGGIWLYVAGDSQSLLRFVRINGAGHTLWDVWSPYYCWHAIGDFQRHPVYNTVWITSLENRNGGQDFRSYLYCMDINGRFLFGHEGILNVGRELTQTSNGMIAFETDFYAPARHSVAKRIHTSGRILWQSIVAVGLVYCESGAPDGADGTVVALNDGRSGPPDFHNISAQRVLANGMLGSPPLAVRQHPEVQMQSFSADRVSYVLPQAGNIKLELFDLLGRKIVTLEEGHRQAGTYITRINVASLPSGLYLLRLNTPAGTQATKLVIMR